MKNRFAFVQFLLAALLVVTQPTTAEDGEESSIADILGAEESGRANLVCPFTVTNGPKSIGTVIVGCYTDANCSVGPIGNAAWGGFGGTPTLNSGVFRLSNDAMANVGLTALTTTQSVQVEVHNPGNTAFAQICMQATIVTGEFTCTGGPYTLNINNL